MIREMSPTLNACINAYHVATHPHLHMVPMSCILLIITCITNHPYNKQSSCICRAIILSAILLLDISVNVNHSVEGGKIMVNYRPNC